MPYGFNADKSKYDLPDALNALNDASVVAIYSAYNPYDKDHLLTPAVSEYNGLISAGWTGEGIKFYAIAK